MQIFVQFIEYVVRMRMTMLFCQHYRIDPERENTPEVPGSLSVRMDSF